MKRAGFTLIELLTSMAVISILLAISLPAYRKIKQAGTGASCRANLHACAAGFRMYLDDYGNNMPPAATMLSYEMKGRKSIAFYLEGYISGEDTLRCPGDTRRKFYETEETSYEFSRFLSGKNVNEMILTRGYKDYQIHVLSDFEPFHGSRGTRGAFNYLYADGHVGDRETGD